MSSYGSRWPGTPAFTAQVASQGIYANTDTPLSVIEGGGGGTLPGNLPSTFLNSATTSTLDIYFDSVGTTGSQPISYALSINQNGVYVPPTITPVLSTGTIYTSRISSFLGNPLIPGAAYWFYNTATNSAGSSSNGPIPISTLLSNVSPPGNLPIPQLESSGISSLSIYIDTAGVTGTEPISYQFSINNSGNVPQPTITPVLSTGTTIYKSLISTFNGQSLTQNTYYYFWTFASNAVATAANGYPGFYSTINSPSSIVGQPSPPSLFNSAGIGPSSTTVYFNTEGITGNPTPTYTAIYGTTATQIINYSSVTATLSSGSIYTATMAIPSTINLTYNIYSQAVNGGPSQTSVLPLQFFPVPPYDVVPVDAPPPDVTCFGYTNTSLNIQVLNTGMNGNPVPIYTTLYGTASNTLNASTFMLFDPTYNQYRTVISSLTANTPYYFQAQASNVLSTTTSAIAIFSTLT